MTDEQGKFDQRGDIVDILATFVENVKVANSTTANTADNWQRSDKNLYCDVLQKVVLLPL